MSEIVTLFQAKELSHVQISALKKVSIIMQYPGIFFTYQIN